MSSMGMVHLITSFMAIGAGGWVLLIRKGTRWHRTIGHLYAMSMVGVLASAFAIYDLTGSFGPFHFAALVGTFTLAGGLYSVLARRPKKGWMTAHAIWMSWSYIGLMAALVAETATRFAMPRLLPLLRSNAQGWAVFWTSVALASSVVFVLGWWLVKTRLPASVAATPEAMRREREALRALDGESAPGVR